MLLVMSTYSVRFCVFRTWRAAAASLQGVTGLNPSSPVHARNLEMFFSQQ